MKKSLLSLATAAVALFAFTGCSGMATVGNGANGLVYTDTTIPLSANRAGSAKQGTSVCTSILSLVAIGDCSAEAAAKNGGISTIQSVDAKVFNILGLYGTYTTIVKGN